MLEQNIEPVYQRAVERLARQFDFSCCSLFVFEDAERRLSCVARLGDGVDFIEGFRFGLGSGLSAWVAQKHRRVNLPDIHRGSRHGHKPLRCYLSVPLMIEDCVIGVLNLAHVVPNAFDDHLDEIETFSRLMAQTMQWRNPDRLGVSR